MKIQIIQTNNNKRNGDLTTLIAEALKDLDGEITIDFIFDPFQTSPIRGGGSRQADGEVHTFAGKSYTQKENISKQDDVYELVTLIHRAGKSKEYRSFVHNQFPSGLDFDKCIGYLYTHKAEILKACGL